MSYSEIIPPVLSQVLTQAETIGLTTAKDVVEIIQSVVTIVAIVVGAYWAYSRFVKGRLSHPHANIKHEVSIRPIDYGMNLLRVNVIVENVGNVLLKLGESVVRIQQILPLPPNITDEVERSCDPVAIGQTEIQWPGISSRQLNLAELPIQLEPGESDEIVYDFILENTIKTVKIYSHYQNTSIPGFLKFRKKALIGWKRTTVHDLPSVLDNEIVAKGTSDLK